MATKSFLTPDQMEEARGRLKPPPRAPDGDEKKRVEFDTQNFSRWLSETLLRRLEAHPHWTLSGPIALGSWARGELSPKSDIDLLFSGDEASVRQVVSDFAREGLKLRSRMPEDEDDWTIGVQPFDILSLLQAVPLVEAAEERLGKQLAKIGAQKSIFRKTLLKAMVEERRGRNDRYDSISNFLEPNLKYGPGGLRDLEQALSTRGLFPDKFVGEHDGGELRDGTHAFDVLRYYKDFLLLVRQKLHLTESASEVLAAPEQKPISDWLGFREPRDFMREIQKGVSRVSFYADWVVEQVRQPQSKVRAARERPLSSVASLLKALRDDPSVLMQNQVRLVSDQVFRSSKREALAKIDRQIGKELTAILDPAEKEASMIALFRSRLIDHCVPEFRKIVGYVQHDQYHRFSVDAHLLQVLRELKRLRQTPGVAGKLTNKVKRLTKKEWEVLAFSGLYHDIAKGRGGDHSVKGIAIAKRDLTRFGKSAEFIDDVCWIVEEHLLLSAAAFRENPRSPKTWRGLIEKGVKGRRLLLLAVFTIADIRATNPEAWTSWKERLLNELVDQLEKPETDSLIGLGRELKRARLKDWERYVDLLDPFLIRALPAKRLARDIQFVSKEATSAPLVIRTTTGTWIRFHSKEDLPGLFLKYVGALSRSGLSVRHASILTDAELGVYDWFEVKTSRTKAQIEKLLAATLSTDQSNQKRAEAQVEFDLVDLVTSDQSEWVISFRGRDQSGALTAAATALFRSGAEIRWAKVHTWGRQIDDVFGITPVAGGTESFLRILKSQLGGTPIF